MGFLPCSSKSLWVFVAWLLYCKWEERLWTKVASCWEHGGCLFCEHALSLLTHKKQLSLQTLAISSCSPNTWSPTEEKGIHPLVATYLSYMHFIFEVTYTVFTSYHSTQNLLLSGTQIWTYAISSNVWFKKPAQTAAWWEVINTVK